MTQSSKEVKFTALSKAVMTSRNKLMSWESVSQGSTRSGHEVAGSKTRVILKPLGFVSRISKFMLVTLLKLPNTAFKFAYEIAKFFARGLSSTRRFLFVAK